MDLRTLVIAALLVQWCSALALLLISRSVEGMRGLRWFAWAYLAVAVAFTLFFLVQGSGLPEVYGGRVLFLLCLVLMTQGFTEYTAAGASSLRGGLVLLVIFAAVEFFCLPGHPVAALRVFGVFFCAQSLVCLLLLAVHRDEGERRACLTVAALLGGILALIVGRAVMAPFDGSRLNLTAFVHPNPMLIFGAGAYMVLIAVLAFGLIWMMTTRLRNQMDAMARTDTLTGLHNRRAIELEAQRELAHSRRTKSPLALVAIDLDQFKSLNDTYGHVAGDAALTAAAQLLSQCLRNHDHLARLGGDEFAALLPGRDAERAALVAERLRSRMAEQRIGCEGHLLALSASFGIAMAQPGDNWTELLQRADAALYEAKRSGRNRVRLGVPHPEEAEPAADGAWA